MIIVCFLRVCLGENKYLAIMNQNMAANYILTSLAGKLLISILKFHMAMGATMDLAAK